MATSKIDGDGVDQYRILLRVMGDVLVEIRATENLQKAKILSDVFHNVPAGIASRFTPEAIEKDVYQRAARLKCEKQVDLMFASARRP
ncbi:hypothetical protein [Rhizobium phaseoli]|uniref:hypothetical protein n=1 Tax=Rhizobium phaseoli TaxID=396 RepID=UPI000F87B964|nr:hypothetical protein [Rhizobium phaseoli]